MFHIPYDPKNLEIPRKPPMQRNIPEGIISAFREVLLNAMEYGANFDPGQHVEISFIRARRMVACRVKDPGQGFSLEELRHAAINNPPDDLLSHFAVREAQGLRPGGFGLLLAKKLVDELIYDGWEVFCYGSWGCELF